VTDLHETTLNDQPPDGHEPTRTRVPMPIATLSDPHLGDAAKNPSRAEGIIALILVVGIVMVVGFGIAYTQNWNPWAIGGTMGAGLFLLGFGLTAWGKYLMPQGPFVEERHVLASSDEERASMSAALVERSAVVVKRRKLLGGLFALGSAIFGIVALFPLLRSLGPLPGTSLETTNWRKGSRLVDSNGRPVNRGTLVVGGIMTVFPEGWQNSTYGQSVDQTVLIRVQDSNLVTAPGRESWAPEGYVAYSKLCTHLGCPVGLYEQQLELLVCPCHQSMFNVRNGAIPQFGPAPRPLPQLALYFDSNGDLRSQAQFDQAVGPGFYERTTTNIDGT
jgi:ubiquinol-cytochrome c reductase iron-sulfur subunit